MLRSHHLVLVVGAEVWAAREAGASDCIGGGEILAVWILSSVRREGRGASPGIQWS